MKGKELGKDLLLRFRVGIIDFSSSRSFCIDDLRILNSTELLRPLLNPYKLLLG